MQKNEKNILSRVRSITPALRWALVAFCLSELGNSAYEGSVLPTILIVGLPAWVVPFRKTFGTIADFTSPISGWIVDKLGGFRSLALAEGMEGVLSLIPLIILWCVPNGSLIWKWSLLALSCALLLTGQVIDIAAEVFEVDAAGDDEDMLINYSGILSIIASITVGLLGTPIGAWIATWSIPAVLIFSAVTSFASCSTRFIMQADIAHMVRTDEKDSVHSTEKKEKTLEEDTHDVTVVKEKSSVKTDRIVTTHTRLGLLLGSFLISFIPACSISYVLLGIGARNGSGSLSSIYLTTGIASVVGSFIYAHYASPLGMRKTASAGTILMVISYALMLSAMFLPWAPLLYAAFFLQTIASSLFVEPIIVSRQILFSGSELARFSGWARLAYAFGSAGGSWIGWMLSSSWRLLPLVSLILTIGICFVLPQIPGARKKEN
ncbi:MFS transporter [Alloscardovia theropitheci]|uniref:MFS transporter n=1 Tax=Alloscardovia theropitheci TaxID=2496842 RepID=A0A4R0QYB7_9BIFI|nr:MFS transporter [Alloscardovia theropitheci]TCD54581.1 MFS transporter [Alloscardovia theropitheci]